MKTYKLVDLFGRVSKLSCRERQFYEAFLEEVTDRESKSPFKRHFDVERSNKKDSKQDPLTIKFVSVDKNDEPQSFLEWKSFVSWNKISSWKSWRRSRKTKIYLLPVGPFPDFVFNEQLNVEKQTLFEILLEFAEVFFPGVTVTLLPTIEFKELGCKTRYHHKTKQLQIFLSDVLDQLDKAQPKDAYGIVAVTWVDLYPSEDGNHVVGEGNFQTGCAALGFSHYALRNVTGEAHSHSKRTSFQRPRITDVVNARHSFRGLPLHRSDIPSYKPDHRRAILEERAGTYNEARTSQEPGDAPQRRKSGEYMHCTLLHTSSEIGLRSFSLGLRIPPLYSMRGTRSCSYTDLTSVKLMTIDKELTCSLLSLKELDRQTKLSSSSWLQLFSDDTSGFSSSFEDFEIINTVDEDLSSGKVDELAGDTSVIEALPVGADFVFSCSILWRMLRALSHEICHLFGLSHCHFYTCAMNTSHSIQEADSQPLFLCPVCLRKLQRMLKFDIFQRYATLRDFLIKRNHVCVANKHLLSSCTVTRQGLVPDSLADSPKSDCQLPDAVTSLMDIISFAELSSKRK